MNHDVSFGKNQSYVINLALSNYYYHYTANPTLMPFSSRHQISKSFKLCSINLLVCRICINCRKDLKKLMIIIAGY